MFMLTLVGIEEKEVAMMEESTSKPSKMHLRVIEFFSGIGGMHYALKNLVREREDITHEVVAAYDFSTTANDVYRHNHTGSTPPSQQPIQNLTQKSVEALNANMWLMSPPCQPHTRQNNTKKRDLNDKRSAALIHLIEIMETIITPPSFFLLENVVNFESSESCKLLTKALKNRGYGFKVFNLSPTDLGIPNTRPRIFLLASRDSRTSFVLPPSMTATNRCKEIRDCVNPANDTIDAFLVPKHTLEASGSFSFDIVTSSSQRSACFTHSYYRYMKGTGSILLMDKDLAKKKFAGHTNSLDYMISTQKHEDVLVNGTGISNVDKKRKRGECEKTVDEDAPGQSRGTLPWYDPFVNKLRYFSPNEIASLLGFPSTFEFPTGVSLKKQYALVGNSLHVSLVTELLKLFLPA